MAPFFTTMFVENEINFFHKYRRNADGFPSSNYAKKVEREVFNAIVSLQGALKTVRSKRAILVTPISNKTA